MPELIKLTTMTFECNDATAKMVAAFRRNDGREALANLAIMWASAYDLINDKLVKGEEIDESTYCLDGLNLLTKFIQRLNDR